MSDELVRITGVDFWRGPDQVLRGVELVVYESTVVGIRGASGSGKTTLLHLVAGLLAPASGRIVVSDHEITEMSDAQRSHVRLHQMGIVFQSGDLLPELSVVENVALPLVLMGQSRRDARARAIEELHALGIADLADRGLGEVSGGQRQRVAIARALIHRPKVLLADEPTGSLDEVNAAAAMKVMIELARDRGTAVVIVTHSDAIARSCDRIVEIDKGSVVAGPVRRGGQQI